MKKIVLALLLPAFGYGAFPQSSKEGTITQTDIVTAAVVFPKVNAMKTSVPYINNVSIKAVRHFKKTFKNASDEKWYEMPDGYRVNFMLNDIRCRLDYDKNGTWLHTIKYCNEKK